MIFNRASHRHLEKKRPGLLKSVDAIMATIADPDFHQHDPKPGRERFYRQHLDSKRWLRVVVDFNQQPAWVVTAIVQFNDPRTERWPSR